ncbi:MAG: hypothetical protein MTP17_02675 [Candidatus Midichloria sp.]|nr:MAG: hypothetical protein MTP17_02675 [Candidatus Midichloria sp.]
MLYDTIFNLIKEKGLMTIKQLEKELFLDQYTIMEVIRKLIHANKIKNINEENNCCSLKEKNCTGCASLIKKEYYTVY